MKNRVNMATNPNATQQRQHLGSNNSQTSAIQQQQQNNDHNHHHNQNHQYQQQQQQQSMQQQHQHHPHHQPQMHSIETAQGSLHLLQSLQHPSVPLMNNQQQRNHHHQQQHHQQQSQNGVQRGTNVQQTNGAGQAQASSSSSTSSSSSSGAFVKKELPANGKKTKGRVRIKMEFIHNKLRRYTTFSKRKTGIMKKAFELATLTGTQVMLLVASETGHVYTFATRKLQPMIISDAGKALIQTCLNSPDSDNNLLATSSASASDQQAGISNNGAGAISSNQASPSSSLASPANSSSSVVRTNSQLVAGVTGSPANQLTSQQSQLSCSNSPTLQPMGSPNNQAQLINTHQTNEQHSTAPLHHQQQLIQQQQVATNTGGQVQSQHNMLLAQAGTGQQPNVLMEQQQQSNHHHQQQLHHQQQHQRQQEHHKQQTTDKRMSATGFEETELSYSISDLDDRINLACDNSILETTFTTANLSCAISALATSSASNDCLNNNPQVSSTSSSTSSASSTASSSGASVSFDATIAPHDLKLIAFDRLNDLDDEVEADGGGCNEDDADEDDDNDDQDDVVDLGQRENGQDDDGTRCNSVDERSKFKSCDTIERKKNTDDNWHDLLLVDDLVGGEKRKKLNVDTDGRQKREKLSNSDIESPANDHEEVALTTLINHESEIEHHDHQLINQHQNHNQHVGQHDHQHYLQPPVHLNHQYHLQHQPNTSTGCLIDSAHFNPHHHNLHQHNHHHHHHHDDDQQQQQQQQQHAILHHMLPIPSNVPPSSGQACNNGSSLPPFCTL